MIWRPLELCYEGCNMTRFIIFMALALMITVFIKVGNARANSSSVHPKNRRFSAKNRGWLGGKIGQKELDPEYYKNNSHSAIAEAALVRTAQNENSSEEIQAGRQTLDGFSLLRKVDNLGHEYTICHFDATKCVRFQNRVSPAEPLRLFAVEEVMGLRILFDNPIGHRYALVAEEFRFKARGLSCAMLQKDGSLLATFSDGRVCSFAYDSSGDVLSASSSTGVKYTVCSPSLMIQPIPQSQP